MTDESLTPIERLRLAVALTESYEDGTFECEPEYVEALLKEYDAQVRENERFRSELEQAKGHVQRTQKDLRVFIENAEKAGSSESEDRWYRGSASAWRDAAKRVSLILSLTSTGCP